MHLKISSNHPLTCFMRYLQFGFNFELVLPFSLKLNRDLYNVMKQVENQHSGKAFIVKGLNR